MVYLYVIKKKKKRKLMSDDDGKKMENSWATRKSASVHWAG